MSSTLSDLEAELLCSICLDVYHEPVLLGCGHNFCYECLSRLWDSHTNGKSFSCPECRAEYQERPAPQRNLKLSSIIERYRANRTPHHCSDGCPHHGQPWKYYSRQKSCCLCESCLMEGGHKAGPGLQLLDEALARRKAALQEETARLRRSLAALSSSLDWLQEAQAKLQADRSRLRAQVLGLFTDIRNLVAEEEKSVLAAIDREERLEVARLEERVQDLVGKQRAVSKALQKAVSAATLTLDEDAPTVMGALQTALEQLLAADVRVNPCTVHRRELDRGAISQTGKEVTSFMRRLGQSITSCSSTGHKQHILVQMVPASPTLERNPRAEPNHLQPAQLTLDVNTAHRNLLLSRDLQAAEWTEKCQPHPPRPERFKLQPQVLCTQGFTTGSHFWDVELMGTKRWEVGATCKGPGNTWVDSCISWVLRWDGRQLQAFQGSTRYSCHAPSQAMTAPFKLRVRLECERKTISFYEIGGEAGQWEKDGQLLHVFNIRICGPVHPGFYLDHASIRLL
ncbi:E3 ubiquitin-protein ligase TRIM11-like [Polypterus senegalus]|uniref:E3 ubiquitin-protein ligase TRIM11-like n=1 Tax=Polypterus senegalus TaxID=55291 RepID=UPI0019628DF6|nr:E3 ubiquitin-protein ligase TRIM11-like [Polypterus senegalus]